MHKRKFRTVVAGITKTLTDNKISMGDGAEIMVYLLVAGLIADSQYSHDKKEWLEWIEYVWDTAENSNDRPSNVILFKKQ